MDFKEFLKKLAPTAATLIGGPLAGLAVKTIGDALGMEEATVEKIEQAVIGGGMTPEQIAAMRTADHALKVRLAELGVKVEEVEAGDRRNARDMQVATRARTPAVLSWTIVGATLFLEGWVLIYGVPPGAPDVVVGRVLGTLDVAFITVLTFWLGTAHQAQGRVVDARR